MNIYATIEVFIIIIVRISGQNSRRYRIEDMAKFFPVIFAEDGSINFDVNGNLTRAQAITQIVFGLGSYGYETLKK